MTLRALISRQMMFIRLVRGESRYNMSIRAMKHEAIKGSPEIW